MVNFKVAIDGPAGSGKSSISKLVSDKLGFTHIDTGAMYRAVTIEALNRKIDVEDQDAFLFVKDLDVKYVNDRVYLNGKDVTNLIRSDEVTANVSSVSKHQIVREKMVDFQRKSAKEGKVLMDGRDIGTVVLQDANLKIFLTASKEVRAKRRLLELDALGEKHTFEEVLKEISERDFKDSNREISPLRRADDAIEIDTSLMSINEVCNLIIKLVNERLLKMEEIKNMDDVVIGKRPRVHDIVEGTVLIVKDTQLIIDLQSFTEGVMHLDHYTKDKSMTTFKGVINVGDKITCEITKVDNQGDESHIYLSRLNLLANEKFKELAVIQKDDTTINVKVIRKGKKGGYEVKYHELTLFMPESQSPDEVEIGKAYDVKVIDTNERMKSAIVSARIVEREAYNKSRKEEFDSIKIDDVLKGTISKIEPFGIFVRFKYNQGLIRIKDVSHTFIRDLSKEFEVGSEIEVKVISKDNDKIALSRKVLLLTPYEDYVKSHKIGDKVEGKCVNKLPFGLIIELSDNVRGLLHQSEYSWNPNDNFNSFVKIGDKVEAAIMALNAKEEKISLSRKALVDNPWARVKAQVGDIVDVKVLSFESKGMIVEALGVDGFINAFDAIPDGKNGRMEDYYALGDTAKAVITDIDPKQWLLKLSIRKHLNNLERKEFEKYMKEDNASDDNTTIGDLFKDVLK